MNELEQLEKTIAALEAQRAILGEDVAETALDPLRQRLAALQATEQLYASVEEQAYLGAEAPGGMELGSLALSLGDTSRARDHFERALVICQQTGDRQGERRALIALGRLSCLTRGYEAGREHIQQAFAIAEEAGSLSEAAYALTYLGHADYGLGRLEEAFDAYLKAFQISQGSGLTDLLIDNLAGLARVELDRKELAQAQSRVEEILSRLSSHPNASMDEPARVYLTCVRVLETVGDRRAQAVLEIAYAWLQERAEKIRGEELRASFLRNIPAHREIAAEWEKRTYEE